MRAHKLNVEIAEDHQVSVRLPEDFPAGPAEIIVLADSRAPRKTVVRLAGALNPKGISPKTDVIGETLDELRRERADSLARRTDDL